MQAFKSEPHPKPSYISEIILGGQDGLVNVLGVILGVAVASESIRIIIAVGLAATFAESIAMAGVAYTSKMAEKDLYEGELAREKREIREVPEQEREEIRQIYRAKGFSGKLLEEIVATITSSEKTWLDTMMRDELNLVPIHRNKVLKDAAVVGISSLVGSLIPLSPFFISPVKTGILLSFLTSALALFLVGVYKARLTVGRPLKSGLELVLIGIASAVIGYLIGTLFRA